MTRSYPSLSASSLESVRLNAREVWKVQGLLYLARGALETPPGRLHGSRRSKQDSRVQIIMGTMPVFAVA